MSRRSRYALTKVSADLPTLLVQKLDAWKMEIQGINRSQLINDLLTWAIEQGAIDQLYPECAAGHVHDVGESCDCTCMTCHSSYALRTTGE